MKKYGCRMETDALEGLGLTRNEALVYLKLLESGKAQVAELADRTRMHRRTIYDCLIRLEDRGLASFVMEGKTRIFSAVEPQRLLDMVQEREKDIKSILPSLLQLTAKAGDKTEVVVHRGTEGLKNIMKDIIKSRPKRWYSLTSAGKASEKMPFFIAQFHKSRIKERIKLCIIFGKNEQAVKRAEELEQLPFTDVRFTNSKYVAPISLWMYNDKTAFMLWESEIGILIKNRETAETFRNYFKIIWQSAKKIQ